jgi:alpha-tubulin suppressor-like RCC1 family protein
LIAFFLATTACISNFSSPGEKSSNITTGSQQADNSSKIIAIAASLTHNLVLRENGTVNVWMENRNCSSWGECDIPTNLANVTAIGAGEGFSVALTKEGNVVVWGCKWDTHRPPYEPPDDFHVCDKSGTNCPCKVPANLTHVKSISVGRTHILALKDDGTVVAWGGNNFGQCNVPEKLKNVTAVTAGSSLSMALKDDGNVFAWGGYRGRIPTEMYKGMAAGHQYGLLLLNNGTVRAFQGATDFQPPYAEVYVPNLTNVTAISAGDYYFFALLENKTVVGWGLSKSSSKRMENLTNLHNITAISSQASYNLGLRDDGTLITW